MYQQERYIFFVSQGSFEYLKLTYVIYKTC